MDLNIETSGYVKSVSLIPDMQIRKILITSNKVPNNQINEMNKQRSIGELTWIHEGFTTPRSRTPSAAKREC